MKSRSHRLPVSEPHPDDWVDGSWTVDCICGVNFDDGEEMVDCDECGVWVHTRCSRYVKSEKSFACDKCKSKNSVGRDRNDSEETEVAEFLVELPTKTLSMDNPNPLAVPPLRRPLRLWTPMEDRVHVQGVPGGEPGLFSGINMSPVFGPELWKSCGYVPKKFNFKYSEFPDLDGDKVEKKKEEVAGKTNGTGNVSPTENDAGVLFSLLKEKEFTLPSRTMDSVDATECSVDHVMIPPMQNKKVNDQNQDSECLEDGIKKDRSSLPILLHAGKRKKQEHVTAKDKHAVKNVRINEKEGDVKKRSTDASKSAPTFSSESKQLESSQERGFRAAGNDSQCAKEVLSNKKSDGLGKCATNLASNEHGVESAIKNNVSSNDISNQVNREDQVPVGSENCSKSNNHVESLKESDVSLGKSVKEEVSGDAPQSCGAARGGIGGMAVGSHDEESLAVDVKIAYPDSKETQDEKGSDNDEASSQPNKKLKGVLSTGHRGCHKVESLPLNDGNLESLKATNCPESTVNDSSKEGKVIEASGIGSAPSNPKVPDGRRNLTVGSCRTDKTNESPGQPKREATGSEGSTEVRKRSSSIKHGSEVAGELVRSNGIARNHSTASYQRKTVFTLMKSSSTSGGILSKSSDNYMAGTVQTSVYSKAKDLPERTLETATGNGSANIIERDEKSGRPRKLVKEHSKSSSSSKLSEPTKLSRTSDSKKLTTEDSSIHSSSKISLVPNVTSGCVSGECNSPPPIDGTTTVQSKAPASAVPSKGEKPYNSGSQSSHRGSVASMAVPAASNVPSTLSDEELALLLHQELNSSPRVTRVPRMRHAGSLPQLTCPTPTSMLMKRSSSGGVKDHSMASRRRTKDSSGEGLHGSLEVDNEAKKMERKPSSPNNRRPDSGCSLDPLSRREAESGLVKAVQSMKKTNLGGSLSMSSDGNGQGTLPTRTSSRNASDDDPRIVSRLTNHTLPGLIAEIMSEGKRMTYEELCSAVLPHWPHLRKHNGEKYAYSSHSQAVLDCLRNRSEWARLVDRGPKTSTSRKRRKLDTDSVSNGSEDNDERAKSARDVGSKSFESHQEDFPKGKRKARKRRRLALQGRGIVRRRRRADVVSDDESESFSNSSGENTSSDEEIQGGGTSTVGNETSSGAEDFE